MLLILEGLVMAFWLLLVCVVGIRNGAVGLVTFYEKDVQDRVVELGLTKTWQIPGTEDLKPYIPRQAPPDEVGWHMCWLSVAGGDCFGDYDDGRTNVLTN